MDENAALEALLCYWPSGVGWRGPASPRGGWPGWRGWWGRTWAAGCWAVRWGCCGPPRWVGWAQTRTAPAGPGCCRPEAGCQGPSPHWRGGLQGQRGTRKGAATGGLTWGGRKASAGWGWVAGGVGVVGVVWCVGGEGAWKGTLGRHGGEVWGEVLGSGGVGEGLQWEGGLGGRRAHWRLP